jgi:hypothetical protein
MIIDSNNTRIHNTARIKPKTADRKTPDSIKNGDHLIAPEIRAGSPDVNVFPPPVSIATGKSPD